MKSLKFSNSSNSFASRLARASMLAGVLLSLIVVSGCPGDDDESDAGDVEVTPSDAGADHDAGIVDAGPPPPIPLGGVCRFGDACESGSCIVVSRGYGICSIPCANTAACPKEGGNWECAENGDADFCIQTCTLGQGCGESLDCQPMTNGSSFCFPGVPCDNDADCPSDGSCQWVVNVAASAYVQRCEVDNPRGFLRAGEACDVDAVRYVGCTSHDQCPFGTACDTTTGACKGPLDVRCASGICLLDGVCGESCANDAACPADKVCSSFIEGWLNHLSNDVNDFTQEHVAYCIPFDGSRDACDANGDCASTEVCATWVDTDLNFHKACRSQSQAHGWDGEHCRDLPSTENVDEGSRFCASNLCLNGLCTDHCLTEADCDDAELCVSLPNYGQATRDGKMCTPGASCRGEDGCAASEACSVVVTADDFEFSCVPPMGAVNGNEPCDYRLTMKGYLANFSCANDAACKQVDQDLICDETAGRCIQEFASACRYGRECSSRAHCPSVCIDDGDCPADAVCSHTRYTLDHRATYALDDNLVGTVGECRQHTGSDQACTKRSDCPAGEACVVTYDAEMVGTTRCAAFPVADAVPTGQDCGLLENGQAAVCESGACLFLDGRNIPVRGTCTEPCETNGDCPSPTTCQLSTAPSSVIGWCKR